ncbi:MAG: DUF4340 domain-containing protein [Burkholderiales bacterium]
MKARHILNLALLGLLIAIGLAAYFWPEPAAEPQFRLSTLQRDDISRIRVERRGNPAIELEKTAEGEWRMRAPYETRADRFAVDRLTDLATATAKQQLPRAHLERYQLDPPGTRVMLNDEVYEFGAINEVTNEQYVAKDDAVYLVATFHGYNVPMDAAKIVSHRLLSASEIPVAFDFGAWQVVRDERGDWQVTGKPPVKDAELSQDDLQQWLAEWRHAGGLNVEAYRGPRARERLTVTLSDGRKVVFDIVSRRPEVRLVRTDENMLYQFVEGSGNRLLDPFRVASH